jgi:hypothetical protein
LKFSVFSEAERKGVKTLLLAMVLLIKFHFYGYFYLGALDSSQRASDKGGCKKWRTISWWQGFLGVDIFMDWKPKPPYFLGLAAQGHMIAYSPDQPGRAQGISAEGFQDDGM